MGDNADPWPIPILALKEGETKSFQIYWISPLIK